MVKYRDFSRTGYKIHYSVPDLFGRYYQSSVARCSITRSLRECKAMLARLNIKHFREYTEAHRAGKLEGLPANPMSFYERRWLSLLGKRRREITKTLQECKATIASLELKSRRSYQAAYRDGSLDGLPCNPNTFYGVAWTCLLGSGFGTLSECQEQVSRLDIRNGAEYRNAYKAGTLRGCPCDPAQFYQVTLAVVLGVRPRGQWRSREELNAEIMRMGISTRDEYKDAHRAGRLKGFPLNPNLTYDVRWSELLGKKPPEGWRTLLELRAAIFRLGLKSRGGYISARRAGLLVEYPASPVRTYKVTWSELFGRETL